MRMTKSATLPVTEADKNSPATELPVPITDINLSLIAQLRDAAQKTANEQTQKLTAQPSAYTLGVGDVLQITVWDHPEFAAAQPPQSQAPTRASDPIAGFVVDESGNLQFPFIGALHVEGERIEQVQRDLKRALVKVFVDPQVTVRIASYRAKQVYVDGEVHTPGSLTLNDIPMTLYEAINRAGGFSPTADQSRLVLVRNGRSYPLNLPQMLDSGQSPSNIILQSGDLLRVVSRDENGVFVMGEVNKPATALPMRDGRLTLSDAISQAGSFNTSSADAAQLYVIRGLTGTSSQVFHLDAHSPVSMLLANQFELQPKDIVYVDGNGLVRFNRVLTLLLPALNAGLTAAIVTK
ncbi:polysaccharide biosynthesis/export family protein [Paraburkholderia madseniana]